MKKGAQKKIPLRITPYHLEIRSLHHELFTLKEPISVIIEEEEDQVITYAPDLEIYGCGDDVGEALEDLRESIVELYMDLRKNKGKLGKDLERIWIYLSRAIDVSRKTKTLRA